MMEFRTVKRIDNSRLVRPKAPNRLRECCRRMTWSAVMASFLMVYAWQHFQCIQLRYQLEDLISKRAEAGELNQQLRLEVASLRSPMRIDAIARNQLGLSVPIPGQVAPAQESTEGVVAQAHAAAQTPRP